MSVLSNVDIEEIISSDRGILILNRKDDKNDKNLTGPYQYLLPCNEEIQSDFVRQQLQKFLLPGVLFADGSSLLDF